MEMTKAGVVFGLVMTLAAMLASFPLTAATLTVPGEYPSVQSAIDASAAGDTILVAAGTYRESLDFTGKSVILRSQDGAELTTLTGAVAPVLMFQGNDRSTVVTGFTIQSPPNSSGAVIVTSASPTLTDNRFVGGAGREVAIQGYETSLLMERNFFTGWNLGGNTNSVVSLSSFIAPTVRDNVFFSNASALFLSPSVGNSVDVANNTFADNAVAIGIDVIRDGDKFMFSNNIFFGGDFGVYVSQNDTSIVPTFESNLAYDNTKNYSGIADPTGTQGNISADPLLGGLSASDFHLDAGSPAIDGGRNAAVSAGDSDFYGAQRIRVGATGSATVDIGAVEWAGIQPSVVLQLSTPSIQLGSSVTISWSSVDAFSCTASGAWAGTLPLSGSRTLSPAAGRLVYKISCTNAFATRLQSATLTVNSPPTAALSISPASVHQGSSATVTWSSSGATTCAASGDWAEIFGAISGTTSIAYAVGGTYTLILTCVGPGGTVVTSAKLMVIPGPTLTFDATDIPAGETTVLTWTAFPGATSCIASEAWSGSVATSGTRTIGPLAPGNYFYQLSCTGAGVTVSTGQSISAYLPGQLGFENLSLAGEDAGSVHAVASPGTAPPGGGLDGIGNSYSSEALAQSVGAFGQTFYIEPVSQPTGAANQTLVLSGSLPLDALTILATGVNGNQVNQPFVITYSDGTTSKVTQSLSDWHHPQQYAGESVAAATSSRITKTGAVQSGTYDVYAYRLPLDSTRIPTQLRLPANRNVIVLAVNETLAALSDASVLDSEFNLYGIASIGHAPLDGGLDGEGDSFDSALVPSTLTWQGVQFAFGSPDQLSAITAATIPLSVDHTLNVNILAAAVDGSQLDQHFIVTYTDGSTTKFTQSLSDWHHPQKYPGESIALTTSDRVTRTGARQAGIYNLYAYSFKTDTSRQIQSLTPPKNSHVVVLAVSTLVQ